MSEHLEEENIIGNYIEKDTKEDKISSTNRRLARPLNQAPLLQGYCRPIGLHGINDDVIKTLWYIFGTN